MNSNKPAWIRIFSHKKFSFMLAGVFLGHLGTWMQITALGWFIYETTHDKAMLALFASAEMLPLALLGPVLGSFADRFNRKPLLIFCELSFVLCAFAGGCLVSIPSINPLWLAALALVEGFTGSIEAPTRIAFASTLIPKTALSTGLPLVSATYQAGRFVGPVVAGILLKFFGAPACFFSNAASYVVVLLVILSMPALPAAKKSVPLGTRSAVKEAFSYILQNRHLRFLFALLLPVSLFGSFYASLAPAFVKDILLLDEIGLGKAMGSMGIGGSAALIIMLLIASKPIKRHVILGSILCLGVSLLLLSFVQLPMVAFILIATAAFSTTSYVVSIRTIGQMLTPVHMRGRVLAIDIWIVFGLAALTYPFFGWIAELVSIQFALQLGGVLTFIVGMLGWFYRRTVHDLDHQVVV